MMMLMMTVMMVVMNKNMMMKTNFTITLGSWPPNYPSYEHDDDEDGEDQEQDDMADENSLASQRTHHLITPTPGGVEWVSTPGYFYNHQQFTRRVSSSNAVIWLCWPSSQFHLLKFKSFCQLFGPDVLFCSRCCAILMLLQMSTDLNWPCPGTALLI